MLVVIDENAFDVETDDIMYISPVEKIDYSILFAYPYRFKVVLSDRTYTSEFYCREKANKSNVEISSEFERLVKDGEGCFLNPSFITSMHYKVQHGDRYFYVAVFIQDEKKPREIQFDTYDEAFYQLRMILDLCYKNNRII